MLKLINRKKSTLIFILTFLLSATSAATTERLLEVEMATVSYDAELIGKWIGTILKLVQLICFILMVVDCVLRFTGNPKRWIGVNRFIVVTYGTSVAWFIGSANDQSYRGFNGYYFQPYFNRMYNAEGWFGFGNLKVFDRVKINNVENGFILINSLFIEGIIFGILLVLALATANGIKDRKKLSHMFGSIYYVYLFFVSFPFLYVSIMFMKQHVTFNERRDGNDTVDRDLYGYYISWVVAISALILIVSLIVYLFVEAIEMPTEIKQRYGVFKGNNATKGRETGYKENSRPAGQVNVSNKPSKFFIFINFFR